MKTSRLSLLFGMAMALLAALGAHAAEGASDGIAAWLRSYDQALVAKDLDRLATF